MLLTPTKDQLAEIKEKAVGWHVNMLRIRLNQGNKRIDHKKLQKAHIDLTEEQEEYVQAKRVIQSFEGK